MSNKAFKERTRIFQVDGIILKNVGLGMASLGIESRLRKGNKLATNFGVSQNFDRTKNLVILAKLKLDSTCLLHKR